MTKKQIELLKLLGYTDTQEDGALLVHRKMDGIGMYVWEDDVFELVVKNYSILLESAIRKKCSIEVLRRVK